MEKNLDTEIIFSVGDVVVKTTGDYTYKGVVVASFRKRSGVVRVVVEDDRGILMIYNQRQLKQIRE